MTTSLPRCVTFRLGNHKSPRSGLTVTGATHDLCVVPNHYLYVFLLNWSRHPMMTKIVTNPKITAIVIFFIF